MSALTPHKTQNNLEFPSTPVQEVPFKTQPYLQQYLKASVKSIYGDKLADF